MSQQINLFNPALLQKKRVFGGLNLFRTAIALLVVLLGMTIYGKLHLASLTEKVLASDVAVTQKQTQQSSINARFTAPLLDKELESELLKVRSDLLALQNAKTILERGDIGNTNGYSDYFKAFSRQAVPGLWLTNISIVGAGSKIMLQGRVLAPAALPNYISRLSNESILKGKSFDSLEINQAMSKTSVSNPVNSAEKAKSGPETSISLPYLEFTLQSVSTAEVAAK